MNIKTPSPSDLITLYKEAMEDQTEEQFKSKFLSSVSQMLKKNPLWYRGYGIYWYSLKQVLISQGLIAQEFVDAEKASMISYDNSCYLFLAAWAYHDERHEIGSGYDELHVIEYDDGTVEGFTLIDDEMEMLSVSSAISQ